MAKERNHEAYNESGLIIHMMANFDRGLSFSLTHTHVKLIDLIIYLVKSHN